MGMQASILRRHQHAIVSHTPTDARCTGCRSEHTICAEPTETAQGRGRDFKPSLSQSRPKTGKPGRNRTSVHSNAPINPLPTTNPPGTCTSSLSATFSHSFLDRQYTMPHWSRWEVGKRGAEGGLNAWGQDEAMGMAGTVGPQGTGVPLLTNASCASCTPSDHHAHCRPCRSPARAMHDAMTPRVPQTSP